MLRQVAAALATTSLTAVLAACTPQAPRPVTLQLSAPGSPALAEPRSAALPAEAHPRPATTAGPIAWETSERAARERARRGGLPLIVYARASWSAGSLTMERTAWVDPRVVAAARSFVALELDLSEAEGDAELYAERYELTAVPMTVLFDPRGRKVAARAGAVDPAALAADLAEASQ